MFTNIPNKIRDYQHIRTLCMDPQKKVECLLCDPCTPRKKPWSCMIFFSMTIASGIKIYDKFMNRWQWHCLFLQKFQAINNENFSKKISGNGPVKNTE